jgi:hypothetical protein
MDRPAPLAGLWYPDDPDACRAAVEKHLEGTRPKDGPWRGLIGPHAGWAFSGDCAGHAYRWLAARHPDPTLVVLFASHRGPRGPHTVFLGDGWETPLGRIPTHRALAARLARDAELARSVRLAEEPVRPARPDNAVELHLPFIAHVFPNAKLLMLGIGANEGALRIGARVGELAREAGEDAVFVGSTDLTHYGPSYGFAPAGLGPAAVEWTRAQNDRAFLDAVLAGDARGALSHARQHQSACCPGAAAAAVEAVRAYEGAIHPTLVEHYLSYDVRPDDSFVGYAGVVL